MFVELTMSNPQKTSITINTDTIMYFIPEGSNTTIQLVDGSVTVAEGYDRVRELLLIRLVCPSVYTEPSNGL